MEARDQELRERAEELLRKSSRVDAKEIHVSVSDAVVTLRGAVDSAIEKRHAHRLLEELPGVKAVSDRLTAKNFRKVPDAELAQMVRLSLQRDPYVDEKGIEVYAGMGEVRLDGTVPTYHMRKAAEDVTWWTDGVTNVENLLLVSDEDFVDVSPGEVVDAA